MDYIELVKRLHKHAVYLPEKFSKNAELLDVLMKAADAIEELLKAAKKMHTWIFLHTGDEQKAYDECGLSEDMNIALGYSGQIEFVAEKPEEERGCPPDYNPGFCYGDEDCDACWEGWRKERGEP